MRNMLRETSLRPGQLIQPVFVDENISERREVSTLPGQFALPLDEVADECVRLAELGLGAVLLFGVPCRKGPTGSEAWNPQGVVQRAGRKVKDACDLPVITDLCLCEYTDHGHCGVLEGGMVLNDPTLELYGRIAVSHARAGADMVAPSGMMDGQVAAIRRALDAEGLIGTGIMAYSAKCSPRATTVPSGTWWAAAPRMATAAPTRWTHATPDRPPVSLGRTRRRGRTS